MPTRSAASHEMSRKRTVGGSGRSIGDDGGAELLAIEVIIKLTVDFVRPGVTVSGVRAASFGRPVTLNTTGLAKPFALGVMVMGMTAITPAFTMTGAPGPAMV